NSATNTHSVIPGHTNAAIPNSTAAKPRSASDHQFCVIKLNIAPSLHYFESEKNRPFQEGVRFARALPPKKFPTCVSNAQLLSSIAGQLMCRVYCAKGMRFLGKFHLVQLLR